MQETTLEIIIDEEFRILLPQLDEETFRLLEENILEYGCRDPLVLWNGVLIDGYNRYRICKHHNIPFRTVDMEFDSREEVLIWIISNQVSRRNLTPIQLSHFRGLHYKADKKLHGSNARFCASPPSAQNEHLGSASTANRLAEHYNVSRETIKRNARLAETLTAIGEISPDIKRKILHGEIQISKSRLEALSSAPKEEIEAVALEMEAGEFIGRAPRNSKQPKNSVGGASGADLDSALPEIQRLSMIISDFAADFSTMFLKLNSGDSAELKTILRSYIDKLEELYRDT